MAGSMWRFELVVTVTGIAAAIAAAAFNGNLLLQVAAVSGVLMIPLYLADRARRSAENS